MATTSVRSRQSELQRFLAFQGNVRWVRAGREAWRVPLRIVSATMAVSDTDRVSDYIRYLFIRCVGILDSATLEN